MDIDIFKYNKQANKQRLIEYLNDKTEEDVRNPWLDLLIHLQTNIESMQLSLRMLL